MAQTIFYMNCGKTFEVSVDEKVITCPHCGHETDETI